MIIFTFPEFVFLSFFLVALLTYLFRQWTGWVAFFAGLYMAGIAAWIWRAFPVTPVTEFPLLPVGVDLSARFSQFRFVFALTATNLPIVVLTLTLTALVLWLAAWVPQGRMFVPLSLLVAMAYVGLALLYSAPLDPLLLVPLLLASIAAVSVFIVQGDRWGQTAGPLRSLLGPVLAFPFFLPVAWYVEQIPLNPQNNETFGVAGWLLALGLLLLLAPVPLHNGQPVSAQSAPPLALAWLTLLYQLAVLSLLYQVLNRFSFVMELAPLSLWLTVGGIATAVWGGLAAAGTTHPGRLWGYAMLHDWGLILLILAVPGPASWSLTLLLFALRAVSVLTAAAGWAQLRTVLGDPGSPAQLQGVGSRLPWSTSVFVLGSLGLAGFPLSAGFTGHWVALQTIAEGDWRVAAVVLLAAGGVIFGCVRLARLLFGPLVEQRVLPSERAVSVFVFAIAILISVGLAFAPQLLAGPLTWALVAFQP